MNSSKYATPFEKLHAVSLLSQKDRIAKVAHAIENHVGEDDYVIELGSGSGIFSLIAAKTGARKVTGVDINRDSIGYAKQAAQINGLEKKVEFIESHYCDFHPVSKADIVICEMLSSMLLVEQQVTASYHAVSSLMKAGGSILPQNARVYVVPAVCPGLLDRFRWDTLDFPKVPQTVGPEEFMPLGEEELLAEFDFSQQTPPETIDETLDFEIIKDDTLTGIVGFFEVDVDEEVTLHMDDGWRHLFVPIETPKRVSAGDSQLIHISYFPGQLNTLKVRCD